MHSSPCLLESSLPALSVQRLHTTHSTHFSSVFVIALYPYCFLQKCLMPPPSSVLSPSHPSCTIRILFPNKTASYLRHLSGQRIPPQGGRGRPVKDSALEATQVGTGPQTITAPILLEKDELKTQPGSCPRIFLSASSVKGVSLRCCKDAGMELPLAVFPGS